MENENLYLIHEDDYIRHIDEKLELYAMLRQAASAVKKLPDSKASKEAKRIAGIYSDRALAMYESWGIPDRYLITADLDDLCESMENELIEPEDAGYYPDDGDCPCCCGERCCDYAEGVEQEFFNDYEQDETSSLSELLRVSGELNGVAAHLLDCIRDLMPE